MLAFISGIGLPEILVILVVALIIFGPKRLPELGRALGKGMGEFRRASDEARDALGAALESSKEEGDEDAAGDQVVDAEVEEIENEPPRQEG